MPATNVRPQRSAPAALWEGARDGRSPRDVRRVWARFLPPTPAFRNPAARLLAEWADAILSESGWEAWVAAHPDEDDLFSTEGAT